MIKKGFSMLEMVLTIFIISIATTLVLNKAHHFDMSHIYYLNDYLYTQSKSLLERKTNGYKEGVWFNSMGRVNSAKTITIGKHKIIIHLGTGYITYD